MKMKNFVNGVSSHNSTLMPRPETCRNPAISKEILEKQNLVQISNDYPTEIYSNNQGQVKRTALMEIDSFTRRESFQSMSTMNTMSQFRGFESSNLFPNQGPFNNSNFNESLYLPLFSKYNAVIPHEYLLDIWETLKSEEISNSVNYSNMTEQKDINENMRAILIDWIVDVHGKFKLKQETLFLTVNIIDRYISCKQVLRSKLQLFGVAALMIACKYEEILCPDLRDFVYVTDKTYSKQEIIQAEKEILLTLQFEITVPTPLRFFEIIALNFNFNEIEFCYGKFLLEMLLIDMRMNKFPSSLIALSAAYLIMKINNYSNYQDLYTLFNPNVSVQVPSNSKSLKECAKLLHFLSSRASDFEKLQAVFNKFSSKEYHRVATLGMGVYCVKK
jgi:G2/mitotic-specific cyclin-B, other